MDMRTGRIYTTLDEARAAGVPEDALAEVVDTLVAPRRVRSALDDRIDGQPVIAPVAGPFKGRRYVRDPLTGNLVRVDNRPGHVQS